MSPTAPVELDRPVDPGPSSRRAAWLATAFTVTVAIGLGALALSDPPSASVDVPFDATRSVVSAPRVEAASAAAPVVTVAGAALAAPLAAQGAAGSEVPRTGGLTDLVRRYFGPATLDAIVIVQCESGFDPNALNQNVDGTEDHGLFQINDVHRDSFEPVTGRSWDHRYDADANTAFAAWLYGHSGWAPWRCNKNLLLGD